MGHHQHHKHKRSRIHRATQPAAAAQYAYAPMAKHMSYEPFFIHYVQPINYDDIALAKTGIHQHQQHYWPYSELPQNSHLYTETHTRRRHQEEYRYSAPPKDRYHSYSRPLPQESLPRCCNKLRDGYEYEDVFPEPYSLVHEPEERFRVKAPQPLYSVAPRHDNPFRAKHTTPHHHHRHHHLHHHPHHHYYREEKESPLRRRHLTPTPVSMPRYTQQIFPEPYSVLYREDNPFRVKYPLPRPRKVVFDREHIEEYPRFHFDSDSSSLEYDDEDYDDYEYSRRL